MKTLNSCSFNIEDEKKKEKVVKKKIKKILLNVKENAPPINFETYTKFTLLFGMYRRINELMLMKSSNDAIFAQCFLCVT